MPSKKNVAVCMALLLLLIHVQSARANESLADALKQRYPLSRIEVQNVAVQGAIARPGVRLRLEADGVPAKAFRVIQANTKSPRFHARDYARLAVVSSGLQPLEPGDLALRRGTELVVLDIKVDGDTVRFFTHTVEPVAPAGGPLAYGCTEFVFRFDAPVALRDLARVQGTIDRWLSRPS